MRMNYVCERSRKKRGDKLQFKFGKLLFSLLFKTAVFSHSLYNKLFLFTRSFYCFFPYVLLLPLVFLIVLFCFVSRFLVIDFLFLSSVVHDLKLITVSEH